jgi:hypothetical protein
MDCPVPGSSMRFPVAFACQVCSRSCPLLLPNWFPLVNARCVLMIFLPLVIDPDSGIASIETCHPERSAAKSKDLQLLLLCSVSTQSKRIDGDKRLLLASETALGDVECSSCGLNNMQDFSLHLQRHGLNPKRVLPGWNHRQGDGSSRRLSVGIFEFQPGAQPRIADSRLVLPKIRLQPTLNLQIAQFQLDDQDVLGKIALNVIRPNIQSD